jgi:hypothetical protein
MLPSNLPPPSLFRDAALPLTAACLIWPFLFGLSSGNSWTPELIVFSFDISDVGWPALGNFLLGLTLGGLLFSVVGGFHLWGARGIAAFAATMGVVFWSLLLDGFPGLPPAGGLWRLAGGLAGVGLATQLRRAARPTKPFATRFFRGAWLALLSAVLILLLIPSLSTGSLPSLSLIAGITGYPAELAQHLYQMIRTAMPWLPVGMLLALATPSMVVRLWAVCSVAAFFWVAFLLTIDIGLLETGDVLYTLPGLALGLWLGEMLPALQRGDHAVSAMENMPREARLAEPPGIPRPAINQVKPGQVPISEPEPSSRAPMGDASAESDSGQRKRSATRSKTSLSTRLFGLALLFLAGIVLLGFSRWQSAIGLGLIAYMLLLWLRPSAWLVMVPAALPLLDLAPWTGRLFLDEFDLFMLVTAGVLYVREAPRHGAHFPPVALFLIGLSGISVLIGGIASLVPPQPLDVNAFASYWSPYNSLRVAKGFLWGGLIFLWIRRTRIDRQALARKLALGMGLGLFGVTVIGAWEHGLFVGFEGGHEAYRIVSTFSSMHTGGGHIEAYLVAALPFLWLATTRPRDLLLTGPLTVLTVFVMIYTVARGGVLAMGLVVLILLVASARLALGASRLRLLAPVGMLIVVALLLAVGAGGGHLQKRFAESAQDWQIRADHWARVIDMMDGEPSAQLFGMGLGSFPRLYLERGPADKQSATFGFATEEGNPHFRLATGDTVYYAQRIPFKAGQRYRLELDVRSHQGDARLDTPVCEKQMLNSRQCEWFGFNVPGGGQWHRLTKDFSSAKVGAEDVLHRPPVEVFLSNPGKAGVVDVDNVRLFDQDGRDVLCNGDFSRGGDCWFFKTHSHLPWHIKNVWVHVLFEQGWVGLILFVSLTSLAVYRLAKAGWRGHRLAWAWLASLAGLLTVGMFDSLLDAPRIAMLLVAMLLLGSGWNWRDKDSAGGSSPTGTTRTAGRQQD